jgi:hypothetical protein
MAHTGGLTMSKRHQKLPQHTPTQEAYAELQTAYNRFNAELFKGSLPACLITLQRTAARVAGHFSAGRFGGANGRITDEIAINPMHFHGTPKWQMQALQTLVHEMVHLWQQHHGKQQSRKAYHNAEWAEKMEAVGLMPSDTGKPGGKKTGQKMADYPIKGGRFETVAKAMLAEGHRFTWRDRVVEIAQEMAGAGDEDGEGEGESEPKESKSGKRVKFTCTGPCEANAWGKDTLRLKCLDCKKPFERAD